MGVPQIINTISYSIHLLSSTQIVLLPESNDP